MRQRSRLSEALLEAADYLESAGCTFWSMKLRDVESSILGDMGELGAASELKSFFGGMGSLNDVFLCEENGNLPVGLTVEQANEELDRLLNRCYREANLAGLKWPMRALWHTLEWRHRNEPSPRIKAAFKE